jgi:transcriptional regulator with XRE-family HTH domain
MKSTEELMIGQQIRNRREALGMTQVQLAQKAGTQQSVIAAIEAGRRERMNTSTLSKIAGSLECQTIIWLKPRRTHEEILDELSTRLAKEILAESSGSTALELQLPDARARENEFKKIKQDILKQRKSVLWQEP